MRTGPGLAGVLLDRCLQPGWLGPEIDRCAAPSAKQQLLGGVAQLVLARQAEAELHPRQGAAHRETPRLGNLVGLAQKGVGGPQPQVGVISRQVGDRQ